MQELFRGFFNGLTLAKGFDTSGHANETPTHRGNLQGGDRAEGLFRINL